MGPTSGFTTRCPRWDITARGGCNGQSAGRRVGLSDRSVGRSAVGGSVCSGWVGGWMGVGWVGWSVGQSVGWQVKAVTYWPVDRSLRFRLVGSVGHRTASRPQHLGAAPRTSLERSRPEVWHTSGFTAATGCPRWGHPCEARGVPHPLPSAGYRTPHIIHALLARRCDEIVSECDVCVCMCATICMLVASSVYRVAVRLCGPRAGPNMDMDMDMDMDVPRSPMVDPDAMGGDT